MSGLTRIVGRVMPLPKDAYSPNATYNQLDIVSYNGSVYICKKDDTKGQTPADNSIYWMFVVKNGIDGGGATIDNGDPVDNKVWSSLRTNNEITKKIESEEATDFSSASTPQIEWIKNKLGEKIYPVSNTKAILHGDNNTTLFSELSIINSTLSGKANKTHTHSKADITDFATHTHSITQVTNLETRLSGIEARLTALETALLGKKLVTPSYSETDKTLTLTSFDMPSATSTTSEG